MLNKALVLAIALPCLVSCNASLEDYQTSQPQLSLETYFDGPVIAWGLVQDYQDKVTRRFCVEIDGSWKDNQGSLAETFYFNDGEVSTRNWQLTKQANNQYIGTAEDVIGQGYGQTSGYAMRWQYTLSLDIDDSNYHFALDDWIYQIDEYRLFNRAKMKKFGITVASLTLFFDKETPLRSCPKNLTYQTNDAELPVL